MRVVITVLQEWIYFKTITDAPYKMCNRRTIHSSGLKIYKNRKARKYSFFFKYEFLFFATVLGYCVIRTIKI